MTSVRVQVVRSLAALRTMRLMMLSRGTARLLAALASALPSITDLLMFTLLIVLLASVMGRDMFAGRLERFGEMR